VEEYNKVVPIPEVPPYHIANEAEIEYAESKFREFYWQIEESER